MWGICLNPTLLMLLYSSKFYCHITEVITYISTLDKIIKLQTRIIKVITFSAFNFHTGELVDKYTILKFLSWDKYLTSLFMYKVKHYIIVNVWVSLFTKKIHYTFYNTKQLMNVFYIKLGQIWVNITLSIMNLFFEIQSHLIFRSLL